jgi:multisubunit Na+/H+ antiporter MnhC subunit
MVAFYALGALVACAILALSLVVSAWLAALIVAAELGAVAALLALTGVGRLRRATPPVPTEAVADVKADVELIKEGVRR